MDLKQTTRNNNEKLSQSELYQYMLKFHQFLNVLPDSVFNLKPKQQEQLRKVSEKCWPLHLGFTTPINDYKGSVVLQGTGKNFTFMVDEAAHFSVLLERFDKVRTVAKQTPQLNEYYQQNAKQKAKDVLPLLLNDLFFMANKYNLTIDKVEYINLFKAMVNKWKKELKTAK